MKVIIQLQYSFTDSRVFYDVKISRSEVSTQPNPTHQKLKTLTQPNPGMDPTHDQLWATYVLSLCQRTNLVVCDAENQVSVN